MTVLSTPLCLARMERALPQAVMIRPPESGTLLRAFEVKGHNDVVTKAAFSPDGLRLATASWDKTAKSWDARTGALQFDLKDHTDKVYSVAFSPDGKRLATVGLFDLSAKVWNTDTGDLLLDIKSKHKEAF